MLGGGPAAYLLAVVLPALALALKLTAARDVPATYLLFLPPVFAASALGGLGPGVVATLVSAGLVDYGLLEPFGSRVVPRHEEIVALAIFVVIGIVTAVAAQVLRKTSADFHALQKTEAALAKSEAQLRTIIENSADAIYFIDLASNRFAFVSPSQERITGFKDAELMSMSTEEVRDRVHPDDRAVVEEMNARLRTEPGVTQQAEYRWKVKSGEFRWRSDSRKVVLDLGGRPVGLVGITRDISEQRALQSQLQVASRLAALGTLVAGVAHEVNNPLAAAMAGESSAAEVLRELRERANRGELNDAQAVARDLDEVLEDFADVEAGTRRIARIVRDLTTFGRVDARKTRMRLIDAVDDAMGWVGGAVPGATSIQVQGGEVPEVMASVSQMTQVVISLVTNAVKSIPSGREGKVTVLVGPGKDGMVRLEVEDNGAGMTPEVMDRMFDPFFTTRDVGQGMGLGLAVTQAIVREHGGTITATSEVGKGSRFAVELPAAAEETQQHTIGTDV